MDLLSTTSGNLQVREDLKKGVYIEGLSEEVVESSQDCLNLLMTGFRNRHVGKTVMNSESSRSHSVLSMNIESERFVNGMKVEYFNLFNFNYIFYYNKTKKQVDKKLQATFRRPCGVGASEQNGSDRSKAERGL